MAFLVKVIDATAPALTRTVKKKNEFLYVTCKQTRKKGNPTLTPA